MPLRATAVHVRLVAVHLVGLLPGALHDDQSCRLPANGISWGVPIKTFADKDTDELHRTGKCRRFANIKAVAERKLQMLDAAATLDFLRSPPGNRLEVLSGDRAGQHSIRINDQWRICFRWTGQGPEGVEFCDYH